MSTKEVTYVSKYLQLKLIRESSYTKEVKGKILPVAGKSIQFNQGAFTTSDKEEIKFLENHKNFGTIFIKVDKDAVSERADYVKDLETRIAEYEAKEKANKKGGKKVVKKKTATKKADNKKEDAKF